MNGIIHVKTLEFQLRRELRLQLLEVHPQTPNFQAHPIPAVVILKFDAHALHFETKLHGSLLLL